MRMVSTASRIPAVPNKQAKQVELSLGLPDMLSHKLFPGRTSLMVPEVAKALDIDEKSVIRLINDALLGAIEITGRGNKSSREHWRIPVASYDEYVNRRSNIAKREQEDLR
jgi:hypothetical protein